ncbi:conserved hypothetical protein [Bathymodiolus platifrons methanotrophic gill symbiont]|uniref:DUF447 domain-containing protein n=1 Tax=Bathymodiolus platifrons methanotrophic gill symbiont TaxID=113268 RepID=UPI000B41F431|nr:DUF447 domain-containing protein [Bathymodiolus platifrons methanotrophic gill symbiont]MCK5869315.1 DUF447 family protein [Methyloprofundus sp.]TXK96418.1 DUF447 domain-containing protein [Methylococcaceae bacterium CS4]TXK96922.1 DUF447 domain-containing protein [Methylococcaceae bacterium HT1]TXK97092.1 DUF447 domain-containing protein [Methylococcaceae bacterium CS5]TXL06032.1 DUF447 domain-containing protein [Methylococcaceae bacterium CS3]TXL06358.1 DUF447 domain-containing protein [
MIQETIVTTHNNEGQTHIAPMGIHVAGDEFIILPFRPSVTLDNILETKTAVINYTDDVRIFAGCVTGRYEWPLKKAKKIDGHFLEGTLAHCEVKLTHVDDDPVRPKLFCQSVHRVNHSAFKGFNRAQLSVLEAAILLSRINRLSSAKIHTELEYLHIGFNKTAGPKEREAWDWITKAIEQKLREL